MRGISSADALGYVLHSRGTAVDAGLAASQRLVLGITTRRPAASPRPVNDDAAFAGTLSGAPARAPARGKTQDLPWPLRTYPADGVC